METILIEEEQISLLGKMLYYSAGHLTEREREVYDHLVEGQLRKVNHHRQRERATHIGLKESQSAGDAQLMAKKNAIRSLRPDEVCRTFVDSWNKQEFETEFFCLAQTFPLHKKKTDNIREYVLNRMGKYQERHKLGPITKRVMEVSSSETHGNKTTVYCIEMHKMPTKNLTMHRQYEMIFEDGAWRIADFETLKSHDTPISVKSST